MTYALFLLVFLCVPIAALLLVLRGKIKARYLVACALVCGLGVCLHVAVGQSRGEDEAVDV